MKNLYEVVAPWGPRSLVLCLLLVPTLFVSLGTVAHPHQVMADEPPIEGTLVLTNNQVLIGADKLDPGTVYVENAGLVIQMSVTATFDKATNLTTVNLAGVSAGIYYVKGIKNGVKLRYKVVKP